MSIQFYFIPPNTDLEVSLMGDRVFCLAHFYIQDENYKAFFLNLKKEYPHIWITLDNSAAERALVTEDILFDIVAELKPNEVVAPDVLFDRKTTEHNLLTFIEGMKERNLLSFTQIFGCPQGKTKEDWLACYRLMLTNPNVTTIGMSKIAIPYAFLEDPKEDQGIMNARHQAVDELISMELLKKPLHFLGMGDVREYQKYADLPAKYSQWIRSSDSCYCVLAGANGIDLTKTPEIRKNTYEAYYHTPLTADSLKLAMKNMAHLKFISKSDRDL